MERVWEEIKHLFEARVLWNDQEITWTVVCWTCDLNKDFLIRDDAVNYCKGHSISAKHKSLINSK